MICVLELLDIVIIDGKKLIVFGGVMGLLEFGIDDYIIKIMFEVV